jgi:hypothetical protein
MSDSALIQNLPIKDQLVGFIVETGSEVFIAMAAIVATDQGDLSIIDMSPQRATAKEARKDFDTALAEDRFKGLSFARIYEVPIHNSKRGTHYMVYQLEIAQEPATVAESTP